MTPTKEITYRTSSFFISSILPVLRLLMWLDVILSSSSKRQDAAHFMPVCCILNYLFHLFFCQRYVNIRSNCIAQCLRNKEANFPGSKAVATNFYVAKRDVSPIEFCFAICFSFLFLFHVHSDDLHPGPLQCHLNVCIYNNNSNNNLDFT